MTTNLAFPWNDAPESWGLEAGVEGWEVGAEDEDACVDGGEAGAELWALKFKVEQTFIWRKLII